MEKSITFKNRYLCIFIDALYSYYLYTLVFNKFGLYYEGAFVYFVCVCVSFIELFFISRKIKTRIALGMFYKLTPFEKAYKYTKKDLRVKRNIKLLKNIGNKDFYEKYYIKVKNNEDVKVKNAEFCFVRDCAVLVFIKILVILLFGIIFSSNIMHILILTLVIYILFVYISWRKAREFVLQILVSKKE